MAKEYISDACFNSDENKVLLAFSARRSIRNYGIGGLIYGSILSLLGIFAVARDIYNLPFLILGLIIFFAGKISVSKPSLFALRIEALVTLLIFIWNICYTILELTFYPHQDVNIRIGFGPLIIFAMFYSQYRKLLPVKDLISSLEPAFVKKMTRTCKEIRKKRAGKDPAIVDGYAFTRAIRGQLEAEKGFFLEKNLAKVFVLTRDDFLQAVKDIKAKKLRIDLNYPLEKVYYRFDRKNSVKLRDWLGDKLSNLDV